MCWSSKWAAVLPDSEGEITLKYLKQFCVIMVFSFLGELCRYLIPYPIPASIYGMVLLFAALASKIVKLEQVRDCSGFLTACLPVLFVAPTVNLMDCWEELKGSLLPLLLVLLVSTVVVFGVAGVVTQLLVNRKGNGDG